MTQNEFVKWVYPEAKALGEINPVFIAAQAALESGWGKSAIGNNLFGITKGSWKGKTQLVTTTEYFSTPDKKFTSPEEVISVTKIADRRYKYMVKRLFRDYDSLQQCLNDHLAILRKPMYSDAWPYRKSALEFCRRIVDNTGAKYATSPDYLKVMTQLIAQVQRIVKDEGL